MKIGAKILDTLDRTIRWKDHDAYQKTLARLLRDLRVETT
jgi:hypothetical protein